MKRVKGENHHSALIQQHSPLPFSSLSLSQWPNNGLGSARIITAIYGANGTLCVSAGHKSRLSEKRKKKKKQQPTGLRARATKIQGLVRAFALNQVL